MPGPIMNRPIDETNFREAAVKVIERYQEIGHIADVLVWVRIVRFYEAALKKAEEDRDGKSGP